MLRRMVEREDEGKDEGKDASDLQLHRQPPELSMWMTNFTTSSDTNPPRINPVFKLVETMSRWLYSNPPPETPQSSASLDEFLRCWSWGVQAGCEVLCDLAGNARLGTSS